MSKTWEVEIRVNGDTVLTLGSSHLSGIENIDDYVDDVRNCAQHLLSFIGDPDSPFQGKRKWDEGDHEGCGIDSQRAFLLAQLRATPSSLNDAMRTMEIAADFIGGVAQRVPEPDPQIALESERAEGWKRLAYNMADAAVAQRALDRNEIARIINPDLFVEYDLLVKAGTIAENGKPWSWVVFGTKIEALLAKADAIIALSAVPSTECGESK